MRAYRLQRRAGEVAETDADRPPPNTTVAIDVGSAARSAGAVEALAGLGVFVRRPTAPGLDTHIRVSVGSPAEREAFAEALPRALAGL